MDRHWAQERVRLLREILSRHDGSARRGSLKGSRKRRGREDGGEPVPADPGRPPRPLAGGAEAPVD